MWMFTKILQGILNYHGPNYLAITLWNLDDGPAQIQSLELQVDTCVWSGMKRVGLVEGQVYEQRKGAY